MTACAVAFERGVDDGGGASFWLILVDAREALLQGLRGRQLLSGFWLAVWAQTESLLSLPIALVLSLDCYLTTAFCQNFSYFFILMMQIIIISFPTSFLHCLRFRTPYRSTAQ